MFSFHQKLHLHISQVAHQAGAYPGFLSMKRLGVFLLPPQWDAIPSQGYPPRSKFAGTHLYTWVKRGSMRVKCLAQEHNTVPRPRPKLRLLDLESSACTNHYPTASPTTNQTVKPCLSGPGIKLSSTCQDFGALKTKTKTVHLLPVPAAKYWEFWYGDQEVALVVQPSASFCVANYDCQIAVTF